MKFTEEHYNILKGKVLEMDRNKAKFHINMALANRAKEYKDHNYSFQRFVWDVFFALNARIGDNKGMSTNCGISGDYNDSHIETAMTKIITKELNINKW